MARPLTYLAELWRTRSRSKQIATVLRACALGAVMTVGAVGPSLSAEFIAAGVPKNLGGSRNYERIFNHLRANGITSFLPTFQYQEVPTPRSFGFESDFSLPCSAKDPGFAALRKTGVKLVVSAELIYRKPNRIGRVPVSADPLSQIIACVGRKNIAAVTNYDEAAFHGISEKSVEALYNRVKQIDSTLPVFMVHAPILTDKPQFANTGHVDRYLEAVKRYSRYADVVGFDVYPVPSLISKAATPTSRLAVVGPDQAIAQYTAWVKSNIPDKKTLIVLQGFAYTDLYAPEFVQKNVPAPLRAIIKPPSRNEIDSMVAQAKAAGVGVIIWWGQASLNSTEDAPWPDILRSARRHAD